MSMRVVTGHTSNYATAGEKKAERREDRGGPLTTDRGQRSPQLPPGGGKESEHLKAVNRWNSLRPCSMDQGKSNQIKPDQGQSRQKDGGGTAATAMWGAPLAERRNRSARHDSRAVFLDTALPRLSAAKVFY